MTKQTSIKVLAEAGRFFGGLGLVLKSFWGILRFITLKAIPFLFFGAMWLIFGVLILPWGLYVRKEENIDIDYAFKPREKFVAKCVTLGFVSVILWSFGTLIYFGPSPSR